MRLVFVCTGAINRSPAAAIIYNTLTGRNDACAAAVSPMQEGRPLTKKMQLALGQMGYAIPWPPPRSVFLDHLDRQDDTTFFYMQPSHRAQIHDIVGPNVDARPLAGLYGMPLRAIPDPHFRNSVDACVESAKLIERCIRNLLELHP